MIELIICTALNVTLALADGDKGDVTAGYPPMEFKITAPDVDSITCTTTDGKQLLIIEREELQKRLGNAAPPPKPQ